LGLASKGKGARLVFPREKGVWLGLVREEKGTWLGLVREEKGAWMGLVLEKKGSMVGFGSVPRMLLLGLNS
jgi:hypothetical protein